MKFIALLRGINVGGKRKVEMEKLRNLLESSGYRRVETYLNSGNVLFESKNTQETVQKEFSILLRREFGLEIPVLIKSGEDVIKIAAAIPKKWKNDREQKTDVAYLFSEIDTESIVADLPFKRAYIDVVYVKGALIWHVEKKDYNKSHLVKITGLKQYQLMTVRNVNTARYLAEAARSKQVLKGLQCSR